MPQDYSDTGGKSAGIISSVAYQTARERFIPALRAGGHPVSLQE
ncbi:hypothetical protein ASZ90_014556 [hydrocarbon metagenome]|uniref:Uncharacterized protein n=1 Tax=hydrocarbon metagenome TaxID=938273 RepID=A0A0W8F4H1_9ZZZZ